MIPLVTSEQMRAIDRMAIDTLKVPSLDLMEAAGRGVAEALAAHFGDLKEKRILVVCGKGNNGGDGFVAARHLDDRGALPVVAALGRREDLSPDAGTNADLWQAAGGVTRFLATEDDVASFFDDPPDVQLAIDALLGTGARGAPQGMVERAIQGLAGLGRPVVAVDIPSGVDADTGAVPGSAVRADLTVTLGLPKCGLYLHPARARVGVLEIADIGLPGEAIVQAGVADFLIEARDVAGLLPRWAPDAHKGDRGRLLIVGGSVGLTGAVTLAAGAALRAGAGLVTCGVPVSLNDILEVKLTEAMTLPLAEGGGRWLSPKALPAIRTFAGNRLGAMVVGPGMSRNDEALELARAVVGGIPVPAVIDADALFAFRGRSGELDRSRCAGPLVLTPHPGEAGWILERPTEEIGRRRMDLAREWAESRGHVLVLKGSPTVIASPEGETFLNPTGGPSLATGGTGDVLAGMIGGFLAQGLSPLHAALAGVFVHGFTADLIVERRSRYGLVASDLVEALPETLGEIAGGAA